jgi:hypothetical protein
MPSRERRKDASMITKASRKRTATETTVRGWRLGANGTARVISTTL